jgi:hypothetical protein
VRRALPALLALLVATPAYTSEVRMGLASATGPGWVSYAAQSFKGQKQLATVRADGGIRAKATGTLFTQVARLSTGQSPSSITSKTSTEKTYSTTGLAVGDFILVQAPSNLTAGLSLAGVRCSGAAANQWFARYLNTTGGTLSSVPSGTYLVTYWR